MPGFLLAECRAFVDGFIRELLPWPLPLRRQGEAGRGCPRFALILKTPLPSPPLPSQGREQSSRLKPLLQRQHPRATSTASESERRIQPALQRVAGDAEPHHHPPPPRQQLQSQPCLRQRRQLGAGGRLLRSEEHTSELQSLMPISF